MPIEFTPAEWDALKAHFDDRFVRAVFEAKLRKRIPVEVVGTEAVVAWVTQTLGELNARATPAFTMPRTAPRREFGVEVSASRTQYGTQEITLYETARGSLYVTETWLRQLASDLTETEFMEALEARLRDNEDELEYETSDTDTGNIEIDYDSTELTDFTIEDASDVFDRYQELHPEDEDENADEEQDNQP